MVELRYGAAINRALSDAMEADASVIVMGEDIAGAGGSFGATRGLLDKFGAGRVLDTPISEAAIAGMAVGAAMSGLKPVFEIMFMDFVTLTMDAIVNQAAKARFMFGGQCSVPLVLRAPHGGGLSAGPQHSQCLEAWFAHVPGLKVVCPSSPASAYALLRSAVSDPDPVIFVEHKGLYARKSDIPDDLAPSPLGKAAVIRLHGENVQPQAHLQHGGERMRFLRAVPLVQAHIKSVVGVQRAALGIAYHLKSHSAHTGLHHVQPVRRLF